MKKKSWITSLYDVGDTDLEGVGNIREWNGKRYMWVLLSKGDDTPARGDALGFVSSSFTGYTVSGDVSACIADWLAGCIQSDSNADVPANGEYFWMQIGGQITLSTTVEDSGGAADGLGLGAGDGACGKATTLKPCGGVLISSSTKLAVLDCMTFTV